MPCHLKMFPLIFAVVILFLVGFIAPPAEFSIGQIFTIEDGLSVSEIAVSLAAKNLIKFPLAFRLAFALQGRQLVILAGDYSFEHPSNVFRLASRLARGDYGLESIKVTFPEGVTVGQMADILSRTLVNFPSQDFLVAAQSLEGYLFPDTYFFPPTIDIEQIITRLNTTFEQKLEPFTSRLNESGRTLEQMIIMASLVEKEAVDLDTRRHIAGILWKRLDQGMPLQVDAVFPYILGKNTFELDLTDLATTSPYNTYRYRGLPAGPIGNPGTEAIEATLDPIDSLFWYYLSDAYGETHYAADFDEHRSNRIKYLP